MRNGFKALIAASAIGAASLAAVQPAEARGGGAAMAAGIVGLGVGAAIASSAYHHPYYGGYGYAPPPPPPVYYDEGYYGPVVYAPGYYHGYYGHGWGPRWGYHGGWRR